MNNTARHITLITPEPGHIDIMMKWENDPSHWKAGESNIPYSRHAMEQLLLEATQNAFEQKQLRFLIQLTGDNNNQLIGTADLFDINPLHRRAGTGILISKDFRKKGYAYLALEKLIYYAFHDLWLQQLYANILADNTGSIKLFEKAGFQKTGTKKAWIKTPDKYLNEEFYQLLNPAYHQ
ncbi:MAG: GNAT family N-acetyltransferase [Bacteroidales bacterium]